MEYYCLQPLYLHTEETPASQRRLYTITYIEKLHKPQIYYVHFIITFLILIILI
jgi:cell division protein FtsL